MKTQQPGAPSGMSEQGTQSSMNATQDQAPIGPVVAAIVVVAVLAIGGLYYWGSKSNDKAQQNAGVPAAETLEGPSPEELQQVSENDDLDTIEAELQFDTENLDAELRNIEGELQF